MKSKKLKFNTIVLLFLGLSDIQAQTMYVKPSSGTQTGYSLDNIKKITLSSGNLNVTLNDNNTEVYTLENLQYLNLSNIVTNVVVPLFSGNEAFRVYPNPITDKLNIDLSNMTQPGAILSIISMSGKTVLTEQIVHEETFTLDISHLPKGIYICRYNSAYYSKTVKVIKQ